MAGLAQITVTYVSTLPSTTSTVVIPVPPALQNLDSSGQTAGSQSGFVAFDTLMQGIRHALGVTFTDASGVRTFVPLQQIVKIVAQ